VAIAKSNKRIWHGVARLTLLLRTALTLYVEGMRGTAARHRSVVVHATDGPIRIELAADHLSKERLLNISY
jgi:hypothetical protein